MVWAASKYIRASESEAINADWASPGGAPAG